MPELSPGQPPPDHYYADNLIALVEGVRQQYGDILTAEEAEFGEGIVAMPASSQRLLARLMSRKGPLVRVDSLNFREIDDTSAALGYLVAEGFVARCPEAPAAALARLLTRVELAQCFGDALAPGGESAATENGSCSGAPGADSGRSASAPPRRSDARKRDYLEWIERGLTDAEVHRRIERDFPWVALDRVERLDLYRLLFFGDRRRDLSTFVLRDLGLSRYPEYELARERRLFADRAALDAYRALIGLGDHIDELGARPPADAAVPALETLWQPFGNRLFERRRSRMLNRLGRGLERVGEFDAALACYARSSMPPARERRVRILKRLLDTHAVERLRRRMRERPICPQEADFAARFGTRRSRAWPRETVVLNVPDIEHVEAAAAAVLTADEGCAWHIENALPMGLFGLAYWDWVFAPVDGMFVNAFQTAPIDLFWPDFLEARRGLCPDPLDSDDETLRASLLETCRTHRGVANRLVDWGVFDEDTLSQLLEGLGADTVRKLVGFAGEDLDNARRGFPDLTVVYGPGRFEFVEVKGPNDRLRDDQYLWIERLQEADLPVRVARCR
ncbi:MAG: VRR-NUC domain-containing protein [Gammaproteobacteria bacterium]|nr:VRR-NUC domain-containing protein [Gammaproteobacteria bacterium]